MWWTNYSCVFPSWFEFNFNLFVKCVLIWWMKTTWPTEYQLLVGWKLNGFQLIELNETGQAEELNVWKNINEYVQCGMEWWNHKYYLLLRWMLPCKRSLQSWIHHSIWIGFFFSFSFPSLNIHEYETFFPTRNKTISRIRK